MTGTRPPEFSKQVVTVAGDVPYDVVIGRGLNEDILAGIPDFAGKVAIIHPPTLRDSAAQMRDALVTDDRNVITIEIPDGEKAKTTSVADYCWSVLGQSGFTRTDLVIGFGGGATTDLAGFVAATWLRGVQLIQIPTTLLAMVDAAVGGKTGINTAEGKNLVGSFYPPRLVIADLAVLPGIPEMDFVSGLAEVIKCCFIVDPVILELIETDPAAAVDPTSDVVAELVRRSVQVKADVVASDLKEAVGGPRSGGISREVLNYGHTLAHAIERVEGYKWRHGAAVSVGMMYVAQLAGLGGRLSDAVVDRHRDILTSVGLPISYEAGQWNKLYDAMKLDKKTRADVLRFVVLDDLAKPVIMEGPNPVIMVAAYNEITPEEEAK